MEENKDFTEVEKDIHRDDRANPPSPLDSTEPIYNEPVLPEELHSYLIIIFLKLGYKLMRRITVSLLRHLQKADKKTLVFRFQF